MTRTFLSATLGKRTLAKYILSHLWIGTQADNMQDCIAKGRFWRGGNKRKEGFVIRKSK